MTDLERIDRRISEIKAELADLEIASRVLHNLPNDEAIIQRFPSITPKKKKPARKTIIEFCEEFIEKHGDSHFREIAQDAIAHGYKGRTGSTKEQIEKSFWATMNRKPEVFESLKGGKFKLNSK